MKENEPMSPVERALEAVSRMRFWRQSDEDAASVVVADVIRAAVAAEQQRILAHFDKWQAKAGKGVPVPWQIIFINDGPLTEADQARGREVAERLGLLPDAAPPTVGRAHQAAAEGDPRGANGPTAAALRAPAPPTPPPHES